MYNIILDEPLSTYRGHRIRTDFKQGLKFFRNIGDKKLSDRRRSTNIILALFESVPENIYTDTKAVQDLWDFIVYYISGGKDQSDDTSSQRLFDFNADHGRIYAAFLQVYNIDLTNVYLHWWHFLELLENLPNNTKLSSVIEIRGKEIPKKGDNKYKAELRRLKRLYSINPDEDKKSREQKMDSFVKGFFRG